MLDSYSIDNLSIEIYENQFFRSNFMHIHVYVFRLSFITTLNIYKDYFKGRHKVDETWCKGFFQAYCDQRQFVVVHISIDEATAFVHCRVL